MDVDFGLSHKPGRGSRSFGIQLGRIRLEPLYMKVAGMRVMDFCDSKYQLGRRLDGLFMLVMTSGS